MATYKQPCIHCGEMIDRDSRFCLKCASKSPFGYLCPFCLRTIQRGYAVCSGCGKSMTTTCPFCNGQTFVGSEKCDVCNESVMVQCENKRCGQFQFFENTKCTSCGKPIKSGLTQIKERVKQVKKGK